MFIATFITQVLTFLPLAFGISISYQILRATDMTLDGSFVLGGSVFAVLVFSGYSPYTASLCALASGALSGVMVACIQRNGKIDSLLAGVLATFILSSVNLMIMGKPNISLLNQHTLLSSQLEQGEVITWLTISLYVSILSMVTIFILNSFIGLNLRALGDNPRLFQRLGKKAEIYRSFGFALTNCLAAASGCLTAQTIGYADIGMGFGMTLTGIGAIIIGRQALRLFSIQMFRTGGEFAACLIGVILYFLILNSILQFDVNPIYLKLFLGLVLILCLRSANFKRVTAGDS